MSKIPYEGNFEFWILDKYNDDVILESTRLMPKRQK